MADLAVLLTLNNKEILRITGCYLIRDNVDCQTVLLVLLKMCSDLCHFITYTCFWITCNRCLVKSSLPSVIHTSSSEALLHLPLTLFG